MAPIYPPSSAQAERTTLSDEIEQEGYELYDNQQEIEYEGYELRSFGQRDQQQQRQHDTADRLAPSPRVPSRTSDPPVPSRRPATSTTIPEQATAQQTTDNAWNAALQASGGDWSHDSTAHRLGAIPRAERRRTSTELPQHVTAAIQALNESVSSRLRSRTQRPRQEPVVAGPSSGPQFERQFGKRSHGEVSAASSKQPRRKRAKKTVAKEPVAQQEVKGKGKGKQRAVEPESESESESEADFEHDHSHADEPAVNDSDYQDEESEFDAEALELDDDELAYLEMVAEDDLLDDSPTEEAETSDPDPVESENDEPSTRSGNLGAPRYDLDTVRTVLGMRSPRFVSLNTADMDRARFNQRATDLVGAVRAESESQPGVDFMAWSLAPSLNWAVRHAPDGYLLEQMLAGLSPEVAEVLGRQRITVDDLLSLPSGVESYEQLRTNWAVYLDVVQFADGSYGLYIGSASSQDRAWGRFRAYVRYRLTGETGRDSGQHSLFVAEGTTSVAFRILWMRPMAGNSPIMPLLIEGLFSVLLNTVQDSRSNGEPYRCSNERIRAFHRVNALDPSVLSGFRQMNAVSPLRQGVSRFKKYSHSCTICEQTILPGAEHVIQYGAAGIGRAHKACFVRRRTIEQKAAHPDACNKCCTRGLAASCDKGKPCNNCSGLKTSDRCGYRGLGVRQRPEDKCERCRKNGGLCDGKAPCNVCVKEKRACSNGGKLKRVWQDKAAKCAECVRYRLKCDGGAPCSSCKGHRYKCSNTLAPGEARPTRQDPAKKCIWCRGTRKTGGKRNPSKCDGKNPCSNCVKFNKSRCQYDHEVEMESSAEESAAPESEGEEEDDDDDDDDDDDAGEQEALQQDSGEAGPSRRSTRARTAVQYTFAELEDQAPALKRKKKQADEDDEYYF